MRKCDIRVVSITAPTVQLSLGQVQGDILQCWYHGRQYDAAGRCSLIPTEGEGCPTTNRVRLTSYPVEDRGGLIWAYLGDATHFTPPPLHVPEELESHDWNGFILPVVWQVNWLFLLGKSRRPDARAVPARTLVRAESRNDPGQHAQLTWQLYLDRAAWRVIEQDRVILESQRGLESRRGRHLVGSDLGAIRLRMLLQRELANQDARGVPLAAGESQQPYREHLTITPAAAPP